MRWSSLSDRGGTTETPPQLREGSKLLQRPPEVDLPRAPPTNSHKENMLILTNGDGNGEKSEVQAALNPEGTRGDDHTCNTGSFILLPRLKVHA